jgi:hypothetical protein
MPDGSLVSATFRGYLVNASQLPIQGGQEGNMFVIDTNTWVLTTLAGSTRLTWVDP